MFERAKFVGRVAAVRGMKHVGVVYVVDRALDVVFVQARNGQDHDLAVCEGHEKREENGYAEGVNVRVVLAENRVVGVGSNVTDCLIVLPTQFRNDAFVTRKTAFVLRVKDNGLILARGLEEETPATRDIVP